MHLHHSMYKCTCPETDLWVNSRASSSPRAPVHLPGDGPMGKQSCIFITTYTDAHDRRRSHG